jgi:His/Glu/Gln/Arg/opine family amino acid ABC transporter permease subunit
VRATVITEASVFYDWHFERVLPYVGALLRGALVTLELTAVIVIIGGTAGSLIGWLLARRTARWLLTPFVDIFRSIPPLVLALFFYYFLTAETIGVTVDRFWVFAIAMSLYMAAFTADIVRSAILGIPTEAVDAARALGFSEPQIARHVSLDYFLRQATPALSMLIITMLKTSSLAGIVNVREIVYAGQAILSLTARSLEVWVLVGLIYTILVLPATYVAKRIEAWAGRGGRALVSEPSSVAG